MNLAPVGRHVSEVSPPNFESESARLAAILADVRARRATGELLSDEDVLAQHADLAPRLESELRKLALVQRARRLAGLPGGASTLGRTASADMSSRLAVDAIPGYEILAEIHGGSQGVVYHAIQKSTGREVAIKVLKHGPFADAYDHMRFAREVQVLGALRHPNIVSIHDSGSAGGYAYFVMDYIDGEPLDAFVAGGSRDIGAIVRLFVKICDAVSAAQVRGVVHRDLKPGNIRIDRRGEPHVLDFGLARIDPSTAVSAAGGASAAFAERAHATVTQTGQFVGSLPWASPEQAEGLAGNVDLRTDVYSLGVMLYQALTGRFPYPVSGSLSSVLDHIQNTPPARPSAVRREIDDEIETIVLKCLQKDRERRYQSAGELSQDLHRYLRGEPIDAKRDSHLYVLRKQLRRYRVPVGAAVAVFASLIVGIIATTRATWRAQRAETVALEQAFEESRLRRKADWETYKACLAAADAALALNNTVTAKARLDAAPPALRGWEWRHLRARLDQSLAEYQLPAPAATRFAPAPDGRTIYVVLVDGRLLAFEPMTGISREVLTLRDDLVTALAISQDGQRLAIGFRGGAVAIRLCRDGREVRRFQAHAGGPVTALAFSRDGRLLASGGGSSPAEVDAIRVWDAESGEARAVLGTSPAWTNALAFGADARLLASGHTKTAAGVRFWDVQSARELTYVDYQGLDVAQIAFSPDGALLAVASQDSAIRVYDARGTELRTLSGHTASVSHVSFSKDGARLASASVDLTVRVWDMATGAAISCRRGHLNPVTEAAFLSDGEDRLVSLSLVDSTLRLWDAAPLDEPATFDTGKYFVIFVAFSSDGGKLFTHQRCWDTSTIQPLARLAAQEGWETTSWVAAGELLAWTVNPSGDGRCAVFREGRPLIELQDALLFRPIASPNGGRLAFALRRGVLQLRRADDGELTHEIEIDAKKVSGASFSYDGQSLVTWTSDGRWVIWDVTTGSPTLSGRHGTAQIVNAAFSRDDRLLATASYDGAARICDAASGNELHELRPTGAPVGDQGVVWSVAFSPDGTRLATGSKDRRIRLWDVATGQELVALTRHAGTVMCLDWSPDGTQLASGGFDGTVCLWDSLPVAERRVRSRDSSTVGAASRSSQP